MLDGPDCGHDDWYDQSIEYGEYVGSGPNRWQEMTHILECRKCGKRSHESDRYYGNDKKPGDSSGFGPTGIRLW